jgi:hypothetical protein
MLYNIFNFPLDDIHTSGPQPVWDRGPVNSFFIRQEPGIINARAQYRAMAQWLRNTDLYHIHVYKQSYQKSKLFVLMVTKASCY